jgi:hypothetical protein
MKVDPVPRTGAGFGFSPVGHRVTIDTPVTTPFDLKFSVVLAMGITENQINISFNTILENYFDELRHGILERWEQTYYANHGIFNPTVNLAADISALRNFITDNASAFTGSIVQAYQNMLALLEWYPAEQIMQSHTFHTVINPQVMAVHLLDTGLVTAVDFNNILINGVPYTSGYTIEQTQDAQFIPVFSGAVYEAVSFIPI